LDVRIGLIFAHHSAGRHFTPESCRDHLIEFGSIRDGIQHKIDHLELTMGRKLRPIVHEATCSGFNAVIIAKFARFG